MCVWNSENVKFICSYVGVFGRGSSHIPFNKIGTHCLETKRKLGYVQPLMLRFTIKTIYYTCNTSNYMYNVVLTTFQSAFYPLYVYVYNFLS